jgi:hypothetical protein
MKVHENYMNGAWAKAPEQAPNINPSNLSDAVGVYTAVKTSYVNP